MVDFFNTLVLSVIIGVLAAIIYSLRILISLEKKILNLDKNIALLVNKNKK